MHRFKALIHVARARGYWAVMVVGAFGYVLGADSSLVRAGTLEAVNHTPQAINYFSVNGRSGLDAIGPYQGGG